MKEDTIFMSKFYHFICQDSFRLKVHIHILSQSHQNSPRVQNDVAHYYIFKVVFH